MTDNVDTQAEAVVFAPADTVHIRRDPETLRRFYLAHYDEVVRYLARRVSDPYDVADLVADTFLAAVDAAGSFDHRRGDALPWLIGIAHNRLRRFQRQRDSNRRAMQRVSGRRLLDADDIVELEDRIDAETRGAEALRLLSGLSTAQRDLIEMVDIHGLTPAEAADAFGVPTGVIRVRLHRARKALRNAFHHREDQP